MRKVCPSAAVALFAALQLMAVGASRADAPVAGGLAGVAALPDGTPVALAGLGVDASNPAEGSVTVREPWAPTPTLTVVTAYADRLTRWMTVDVAGRMATEHGGGRAILDASVQVYTNPDGSPITVPIPVGGGQPEWPWRMDAALLSPRDLSSSLSGLDELSSGFQFLGMYSTEDKIGTAKQEADEETVTITGKVLSRLLASGVYYVEEPNRASGIRIEQSSPPSLSEGDILTITGEIATASSGERYITPTSVTVDDSGDAPVPLRMSNKFVTGGDWRYNDTTGAGQRGVETPGWTNNVGLLVRTWGRVTGVDAATKCCYIDDGSVLNDGTGLVGLRVSWDEPGQSSVTPPEEGAYVSVVGLSGMETRPSGDTIRTLRLVRQGDLTTEDDPTFSLVFDRGLPEDDLNEAAGVDRCNIRWTGVDTAIGYGDDFSLAAGDWVIDTIRVWIVPEIPLSPPYELGDHFQSVTLYGGAVGGGLSNLASGSFTAGNSSTGNPNISVMRIGYAGDVNYQAFDGREQQMWQVDFRNLNWAVSGQTSYAFGVLGAPRKDRKWFTHATHLTEGGDGQVRQFDSTSPGAGTTPVSGSVWFGGKGTDINVQVFAHEE